LSHTDDLWARAVKALQVAKFTVGVDFDTAASKAYYAAFYAVSALFATQGRSFTKHSAVEAAVHRDLVKAGIWQPELGEKYSRLVESRILGDYGGALHVQKERAMTAIEFARDILRVVAKSNPEIFVWQEELSL
jgi:uncharacterized protein (UPF0332 family)